jgi:P22 coat protein - gene protein 5
MANITQTALDDSIATIVAAQSLGYLKANTVLAQLVARDWDTDVATHGSAIKIPLRGALSVNAKAADTVVTLQAPTDTAFTVTLNKHKEVSFIIEDIARAFARPDQLAGYIEDGMKVIAEQIDADLAGLYSGLSQSITATSGLAESDFREARRLLNAAKAPLSNRYAVLNEDGEKEALGIEKLVNRDYRGEDAAAALRDGYIGRFAGFEVHMDQKIVTSTTVKNLFFHRDALALVMRSLPAAPRGAGVVQKVMDEDGMGLRVTLSYNPDHLGVQVTIDVLYGVAEIRDAFGVVVLTTDA